MKRFYAPALLFLVGTLTMAAPALGQRHAQTRKGFWFNGGLGYGTLGCDNCGTRTGGLTGGLSLGGTLNHHILLGVGTTAWTKSEGGATLTVATLDLRVLFYPSPAGGFFLTGGLGGGSINAALLGFGGATETGGGVVLGGGFDVRVAPMVSLTPFANIFGVRTANGDANVFQLGVSVTAH